MTAPLHLVVGDESLLVERAVARAVTAAREADPAVEVAHLPVGEITAGVLGELVSPSLFAESRVVVIENAHDASAEATTLLLDYARTPSDGVTLVVVHRGPPKGGKARKAPAKGAKGGGPRGTRCSRACAAPVPRRPRRRGSPTTSAPTSCAPRSARPAGG